MSVGRTKDELSPVEVVRRAIEGGLPAHEFLTGPLYDLQEVEGSLAARLVSDHSTTARFERLPVSRLEGDSATVDALVRLQTRYTFANGHVSQASAQEVGPFELVRISGAWKIRDYLVDGASMLSTLVAVPRADGMGKLRLRVLAGKMSPGKALMVYLESESDHPEPIRLKRAAAGTKRRGLPGWRWASLLPAVRELPPGQMRFDAMASMPAIGIGDAVRVLVETDRGMLDLSPADTRRRRSIPLGLRFGPLLWIVPTVLTAVVIGLLTTWSAAAWTLLGLSPVLALEVAPLVRFDRRAAAPYVAVLAGMAALAVTLLVARGKLPP